MSNLLLDEAPLAVLPSLATAIGLHEAIVLQQLYWLLQNPRMGKFVDGKKWVYMSAEDWQKGHFPFWSLATVKRTIADLEESGLVCSRDDLNSLGIDRTKWYTIDMDAVARKEKEFETNRKIVEYRMGRDERIKMRDDRLKVSDDRIKMTRRSTQNEPTIPDNSTETHTESINEVSNEVSEASEVGAPRPPAAAGGGNEDTNFEGEETVNEDSFYMDANGELHFLQDEGTTPDDTAHTKKKGVSRSKGAFSAAAAPRKMETIAPEVTTAPEAKRRGEPARRVAMGHDNPLHGETHLWGLAHALAEVVRDDFTSRTQGKYLGAAKRLAKDGYNKENIRAWYGKGGWYEKYHWMGKRGKVPTLSVINETIAQARQGINPETGKPVVAPKPVVAETPQEKAKRELEKVRAYAEKERVRNIAPMDNLEKELKRMEDAYREKYETQSDEY